MPDFVLQTGDMAENGKDSALWATFFDIEHELLRQTSFFPSLGNHDRNASEFYDFFQTRTPYYSFNWGNAHFIVINTDIANVSTSKIARDEFWERQTKWLEEDLAANQKADYRFVVGHHPPFTAVERRQGDNPHMTALTPMFEKYHVTAGLFGHDHNYQHYLKNGVHYIVSGGGGAPLYDVNKPDPAITQKVASIENFVSPSASMGRRAKVQAIRYRRQGAGRVRVSRVGPVAAYLPHFTSNRTLPELTFSGEITWSTTQPSAGPLRSQS